MVTQHDAVHPRKIGQRINIGVKGVKKIGAETVCL